MYFGYPMLLRFLPKVKSQTSSFSEDDLPTVTVLIPAFNEQDCIEKTVRNKLSQDYPQEKLQIIVISDESEDNTDEIVNKIMKEDTRVRLIRQMPRAGKTSGLNLANQELVSDLIIFSDANSIFAPQTIRELVKTFEDPTVGYVTGKMVYVDSEGSIIGDGCSAYMKYENYLREIETRVGSVVGVDGGVDAMRRELYTKLNADQLPDFVQPLSVIKRGFRVVYAENALLNEDSLHDDTKEFRMRVRVSLRALWGLHEMRQLFNPINYGFFSFQLFSHKLLRYLAFVPLILAFISNLLSLGEGEVYTLLMAGQLGFYVCALLGYKLGEKGPKLFGIPYYFCLINIACAFAAYKYFRGEKIVLWKPREG
jgi:cellulose synthase/poly-beta-1,6-N-acetylglucosamine synthase-like glycosyltransferase